MSGRLRYTDEFKREAAAHKSPASFSGMTRSDVLSHLAKLDHKEALEYKLENVCSLEREIRSDRESLIKTESILEKSKLLHSIEIAKKQMHKCN